MNQRRQGLGTATHSTYDKMDFILVDEADWLDPTRPMCKRCNDKVKGKVKKQTAPQAPPPEPWFFSSLNDMSIGDTNEALDALTYFEEQLLSPIQPVVRSFTLYSTGRTSMLKLAAKPFPRRSRGGRHHQPPNQCHGPRPGTLAWQSQTMHKRSAVSL